jgi:hypothetical protein
MNGMAMVIKQMLGVDPADVTKMVEEGQRTLVEFMRHTGGMLVALAAEHKRHAERTDELQLLVFDELKQARELQMIILDCINRAEETVERIECHLHGTVSAGKATTRGDDLYAITLVDIPSSNGVIVHSDIISRHDDDDTSDETNVVRLLHNASAEISPNG